MLALGVVGGVVALPAQTGEFMAPGLAQATSDWWTTQRALTIAFIAVVGLVGGLWWVTLLRRRVAAQKIEISENVQQQEFLQARFQDVVDQTNDFIFTLDFEGRFTSFNAAGERMTGYTREEAANMKIYDVLDAVTARRTRVYIQRRLNRSHAVTFETKLVAKDGRELEVETSAGFIRQDDRLVAAFGIMRDVTERKVEERRKQAIEAQSLQAQKLESLGTLAGGIAHDINNILTTIQGCVDRVRFELPEASAGVAQIDQIAQSSERAPELVQRVLAFSNENEANREPTLLADVAREVYRLVKTSAPPTITCSLHLSPTPLPILADPAQIHQVITNLCSNAWQALPDAKGTVSLHVESVTLGDCRPIEVAALEAGNFARLRVVDNGCGMSAATIQRVFDPFFTTKQPGQGTGLGMAVVHSIVESHRGAIRIESVEGRGSTIEVYFPLTTEPIPQRPLTSESSVIRGHGERLLVVDDEPTITLNLQALLERLGYHVEAFNNPLLALERFEAAPTEFDLVLSDLSMPELNGRDLARRILDRRSDLPFMIYTGHLEASLHQELAALNVRRVLRKPTPLGELAQAIADELLATPTHPSSPNTARE